jgi:hypothetical protein
VGEVGGGEAKKGETWSREAESLIRASGISFGASGVGLAKLRHRKDDAKRRAKLFGEFRVFGK